MTRAALIGATGRMGTSIVRASAMDHTLAIVAAIASTGSKVLYLQGELDKEIARGKRLEVDIARLHAEIAGGLKSQPDSQPTTDNRS